MMKSHPSITSLKTTRAPVSCVIPCYRCSDTIRRAIVSVVKQTLPPTELILVEDGSDDGTLDKLRALQEEFGVDWISVVPLGKNGGNSNALNHGWDAATQPFVAFLDSDDSWNTQKIEIQLNWMLQHPDVPVTGHQYLWLEKEPDSEIPLPNKWFATRMSERLFLYSAFAEPSVMTHRELPFRFNKDKRRCGGKLLWMQVLYANVPIFRLELPLLNTYKAPIGGGGLTGNLYAHWRAYLDTLWRLRSSGQMGTTTCIEAMIRGTGYQFLKAPLLRSKDNLSG
jgi:glycosyltransferase involved in cell wall biosynthesis